MLKISKENLILVDKALFNVDNKTVNFYLPRNKEHVSHSISNYQNDYKKNTEKIEVTSITLEKIIKDHQLNNLKLLKLDIESAEIETLHNMIDKNIFPEQICVEFDELHKINVQSVERFFNIHIKLIKNNYVLVKTNSKFPDMLYVNQKKFSY